MDTNINENKNKKKENKRSNENKNNAEKNNKGGMNGNAGMGVKEGGGMETEAGRGIGADEQNPLEMLRSDHEEVKAMFGRYGEAEPEEKKSLAETISEELVIHMEMEENLFYPEIEKISEDARDIISHAIDEHNEIKDHVRMIEVGEEGMDPDEHVKAMEQGFMDHIREEEGRIFPLAENNLKDSFPKLAGEMAAFREKTARGPAEIA